jgi:hypothetical protein
MSQTIAPSREPDPMSVDRASTPRSGAGSRSVDKVTVALLGVWSAAVMTLWFLVGGARHFHIDAFQNAYNASLLAMEQPEMADFLAPYMPILAAILPHDACSRRRADRVHAILSSVKTRLRDPS